MHAENSASRGISERHDQIKLYQHALIGPGGRQQGRFTWTSRLRPDPTSTATKHQALPLPAPYYNLESSSVSSRKLVPNSARPRSMCPLVPRTLPQFPVVQCFPWFEAQPIQLIHYSIFVGTYPSQFRDRILFLSCVSSVSSVSWLSLFWLRRCRSV
jgi:hypothetical protein